MVIRTEGVFAREKQSIFVSETLLRDAGKESPDGVENTLLRRFVGLILRIGREMSDRRRGLGQRDDEKTGKESK